MNKFYITTSIAYTNDKPHIGFALELVQADCLARYYRSQDHDVFFLTGTDDHGTKIYRKAKELGKTPQEYTAENIKAFQELVKKLNISNNDFISTSDEKKHWAGAIALWKALAKSGDIYKKKYQGLYCVGCEAFVTKKDLKDGKCPNHNKKPEVVEEENYFFKFSKYKDQIIELIKKDKLEIIPIERKNEILNVIKDLGDVSFSRPKSKLPWGIPVPGDETQTMYVWCDALSNYISALGYGRTKDHPRGVLWFEKYWPAEVHCIGKDILKFHAAYWPAMLLSAKLPLPKKIFVHGYITSEGKKMSKSLGNVIDPIKLIEKYGVDPVRYYLLREIPATGDGDFGQKRFDERYNKDLANELGNLLQRIIIMINKYQIKTIVYKKRPINIPLTKNKQNLGEKYLWKIKGTINSGIERFSFDTSLGLIWNIVKSCNADIEIYKPWELAKNNPEKMKIVINDLYNWMIDIADLLQPFLPETSQKIQTQLKTLKPEPLFPRIK